MIPSIGYHLGVRGLHRVSPGSGLSLLACTLFAVLGAGSLLVKVGVLTLVFGLAAWSEGSAGTWCKSLRYVLIFAVLLFLAQVLSIREGTTLFRVGIPITSQGILAGANMALRFLVVLSASFAFVLTTDPDALANFLIRWGIPYRYGFTLILALRFVPFFRNELRTVREAQRLRGIQVSVRSIAGLRKAIRYTFVPVLVSGLIRVDTIAMSMKGRAFGLYHRRTRASQRSLTLEDGLVWLCCAVILSCTLLARRYGWP
ncbi:MAG: energy-coupling factor transporter transmembrane protein EcfT [Lentisphaerae bacterium]|nr:energy-coupling factor transporter transmembrane protein EcfT [Lentisphaerota bacterium]